jgi:hypothetical protein
MAMSIALTIRSQLVCFGDKQPTFVPSQSIYRHIEWGEICQLFALATIDEL